MSKKDKNKYQPVKEEEWIEMDNLNLTQKQ